LLCSFGSFPEIDVARYESPLKAVGHHADTAILLASRRVHREAYDVMVKVHRFIVVRTATALPLTMVIKNSVVTVIALDEQLTSQVRSPVLVVILSESAPSPEWADWSSMSVMLLPRDFPSFCETFDRGGFDRTTTIDVKVASLLDEPATPYKDTFDAFISEETQRSLLAPFANYLRGFKDIRVHGHVSPQLAITTKESMRKDEWPDTSKLL
jgi:hypothetical protein